MRGDWDKDLKEELKSESVNVNTQSLLDLMHTYLLFPCLLWLTLPKCVFRGRFCIWTLCVLLNIKTFENQANFDLSKICTFRFVSWIQVFWINEAGSSAYMTLLKVFLSFWSVNWNDQLRKDFHDVPSLDLLKIPVSRIPEWSQSTWILRNIQKPFRARRKDFSCNCSLEEQYSECWWLFYLNLQNAMELNSAKEMAEKKSASTEQIRSIVETSRKNTCFDGTMKLVVVGMRGSEIILMGQKHIKARFVSLFILNTRMITSHTMRRNVHPIQGKGCSIWLWNCTNILCKNECICVRKCLYSSIKNCMGYRAKYV